ncbi:MAG: hypothetical protein ACRENP_17295 [Longimicrobiales bacterium]
MRRPFSLLVALVIGTAIHLDWHVGRHGEHLSLGLSQHWLLALPIFAWAAWYIVRRWPTQVGLTSALSLTGGVVLGQGLEPLYERVVDNWPFTESFGPERMGIFTAFMVAGIAAYVLTSAVLRHRLLARESRIEPNGMRNLK